MDKKVLLNSRIIKFFKNKRIIWILIAVAFNSKVVVVSN